MVPRTRTTTPNHRTIKVTNKPMATNQDIVPPNSINNRISVDQGFNHRIISSKLDKILIKADLDINSTNNKMVKMSTHKLANQLTSICNSNNPETLTVSTVEAEITWLRIVQLEGQGRYKLVSVETIRHSRIMPHSRAFLLHQINTDMGNNHSPTMFHMSTTVCHHNYHHSYNNNLKISSLLLTFGIFNQI